jgi:hypothetical protein
MLGLGELFRHIKEYNPYKAEACQIICQRSCDLANTRIGLLKCQQHQSGSVGMLVRAGLLEYFRPAA